MKNLKNNKSNARVSGVRPDLSLVFPAAAPLQSLGLQYLHRDLSLTHSEPMSTLTSDRSAAGNHPKPVLMCDLH